MLEKSQSLMNTSNMESTESFSFSRESIDISDVLKNQDPPIDETGQFEAPNPSAETFETAHRSVENPWQGHKFYDGTSAAMHCIKHIREGTDWGNLGIQTAVRESEKILNQSSLSQAEKIEAIDYFNKDMSQRTFSDLAGRITKTGGYSFGARLLQNGTVDIYKYQK